MGLVSTGVDLLRVRGLHEGLRGNGGWLAVAAVIYGARYLGRRWAKDEVVWRAVLEPGQRLVIDHQLPQR